VRNAPHRRCVSFAPRITELIARISLITSRCVGRPIRNLHRSPRPAPIDRFLEGPAKHENDEDENNADHHDLPPCNGASCTQACGNPDDGRRGESLYVMAFLASDNHARTQKTDASHDALNHAAGVAAGYRMDGQNCQGRAETQDAEGAHASRLSMQIAIQAEHDSDQGCSTEPKRNVESVHSGKNFTTTSRRQPLQPSTRPCDRGPVPRLSIGRVHYIRARAIQGDLRIFFSVRQKALIAAVPFVSCWQLKRTCSYVCFLTAIGS